MLRITHQEIKVCPPLHILQRYHRPFIVSLLIMKISLQYLSTLSKVVLHHIISLLPSKLIYAPPTNCVSFVLFSNEIMPAFFQTTHTFFKQNITIHLYTCPQLLECKTLLCEWRIFLRLLIQNYSIGHFKTTLIANSQHK